jgi:hypothetical protein
MKLAHKGVFVRKIREHLVDQCSTRIALSLLLTGGCILFTGCAAIQRFTYNSRVSLYLATNPNVAEITGEALRTHELVKGMNKEEVTLSLGEPTKMEWASFDAKDETWVYWHTESPQYGEERATPETPLRLVFAKTPKGFVLRSWKTQDKNSVTNPIPSAIEQGTVGEQHPAAAQRPAVERPAGKKNAPTPPAVDLSSVKVYSKKNDTSGRGGWPTFTLEGISKQGGKAWALINKKLVAAGDEIETAQVVAIYDDGVLLEYSGDRRVLRKEAKAK